MAGKNGRSTRKSKQASTAMRMQYYDSDNAKIQEKHDRLMAMIEKRKAEVAEEKKKAALMPAPSTSSSMDTEAEEKTPEQLMQRHIRNAKRNRSKSLARKKAAPFKKNKKAKRFAH